MKPATDALEHASVRQHCKALRMPVIGGNSVPLAEQAVKEKRNHIGYLEALLAIKVEERDRHAVQTRLHDARLPHLKTLEEFDFNQVPHIPAAKIHELAEGGYIERAEPVVLMSECGTGKSHLATGLCVAACRQKRRVRVPRYFVARISRIKTSNRTERSDFLRPSLADAWTFPSVHPRPVFVK